MARNAEIFLREFERTLEDVRLPERITSVYQLESSISCRENRGVWLLRLRSSGERFVLRTCRDAERDLMEEFSILGRLPKDLALQVPLPVDCFESDGTQYLIRTYLPGRSLGELWEENPEQMAGLCAEVGVKLCALLDRLHSLDPPVIHRDIKPENIIISPEGTPGLIDFDIARSYKPDQAADTVMMGTCSTAAPEQYGFSQTDQRSDLYALGVTLRWMVSGSYAPESLEDASCSPALKRCLQKAAAFAPEDRYPSARVMGAALKRASRPWWRRVLPAALTLCAAVLALAAVFHTALKSQTVAFSSSLLEQAVRMELDKPHGDVTRNDLRKVRRLALIGQTPLEREQVYEYRIASYIDYAIWEGESGDISDLSPLEDMPNLEVLYLCHQQISDLSPLADLPLRELYLCGNGIWDVTPLSGLDRLEVLFLGDNPVSECSSLAGMPHLRQLNLDHLLLDNTAFLAGLPVENLSLGLFLSQDGDWSPLAEMPQLRELLLWNPPDEAIKALGELPWLYRLILCDYRHQDLTRVELPQAVSINFIGGITSLEGVQRMENLRYLGLCNLGDVSLAPAAELPLSRVDIYNCQISDYSPLAAVNSLKEVCLDGPGRERLEATCPDYHFQLLIQ